MSTTYDVFARKEYPEPLIYIGSVEVNMPAEAGQASLNKFGPASEWIEMLAVPHREIITVFTEQGEETDERA